DDHLDLARQCRGAAGGLSLMDEESGDKQYEPSQQKLQKAREKGDIARSPDLVSGSVLLAIVFAMSVTAPGLVKDLGDMFMAALDVRPNGVVPPTAILREVMWRVLPVIAVVPLAGVVTAVLVSGVTQGIRAAPNKLAPDFSRINPITGLKSRLRKEGITGFLLGQAKLLTIMVVAGIIYARWVLDQQALVIALDPGQSSLFGGKAMMQALLVFAGVTASFGVVDYGMKFMQFRTRMMMSRKELVDEYKENEGDPQMKGQRRQRGQEIALNRMMTEVPKADVIIVNPTHYAVALKWSRKKGAVPICVAKGTDEVAARIRHAAQIVGVPIHRDPPTARAIHATVALGREIQPDHYKAVAIAIRFAETMRRKARQSYV
ncbi:MAG: flagellar type III secretion system protein FlhB, partial [Deltaproteobacteria bacterium]